MIIYTINGYHNVDDGDDTFDGDDDIDNEDDIDGRENDDDSKASFLVSVRKIFQKIQTKRQKEQYFNMSFLKSNVSYPGIFQNSLFQQLVLTFSILQIHSIFAKY